MKAFKVGVLLASMVLGFGARAEEGELIECKAYDGKMVQYLAVDATYMRDYAFTKYAFSDIKSWSLVNNRVPLDFPFPDLDVKPYLTETVLDIPVMVLDVDSLKETPVEFQNFVIRHECAHHEHGDFDLIKKGRELTLKETDLQRELRADCNAIKALVSDAHLAYGEAQIQTIMKVMKDEFEKSSVKKDANGRVIKKGIFKYYGPIEDRNKAMYQCFLDAKAATSPVTKTSN